MRISDWSADVGSSDLAGRVALLVEIGDRRVGPVHADRGGRMLGQPDLLGLGQDDFRPCRTSAQKQDGSGTEGGEERLRHGRTATLVHGIRITYGQTADKNRKRVV